MKLAPIEQETIRRFVLESDGVSKRRWMPVEISVGSKDQPCETGCPLTRCAFVYRVTERSTKFLDGRMGGGLQERVARVRVAIPDAYLCVCDCLGRLL